jgi:hypothetical protein
MPNPASRSLAAAALLAAIPVVAGCAVDTGSDPADEHPASGSSDLTCPGCHVSPPPTFSVRPSSYSGGPLTMIGVHVNLCSTADQWSNYVTLNGGNRQYYSCNSSGTADFSYEVPELTGGSYWFAAATSGAGTGFWFTVSAEIQFIGSRYVRAGTSGGGWVNFWGFAASESLAITFDGAPASPSSVVTYADGAASADPTFPVRPAGVYTLSARGLSSGLTASAPITYLASSASLSGATSGPPGSTRTVSVSQFAPGEIVGVLVDDQPSLPAGKVPTDASGAGSATIVIPQAAVGAHELWVRGETSAIALPFSAFTVQSGGATVGVSPASAITGTTVEFTLAGFQPGEPVSLQIGSYATESLTADSHGAAGYAWAVPQIAGGSYPISAKGATSGLVTLADPTFQILPHVSLTNSAAKQGGGFQCVATGFPASVSVDVRLDSASAGAARILTTQLTTSNGVMWFYTSIPTPTPPATDYVLTFQEVNYGPVILTGVPFVVLP